MKPFWKAWIAPALVLMLIAGLLAGIALGLNPRRPAWESDELTLSAAEAIKSAIWVDARSEKDFGAAHVPGALWLSEDAWDEHLPALLEVWAPEKTVIVYCSSLSCQTSREVAARLRDDVGLAPVFVLQGGWEAWQRQHGGTR